MGRRRFARSAGDEALTGPLRLAQLVLPAVHGVLGADGIPVQFALDNGDIDAVTICVDDPAALHVQVGGVDDAGAPRSMDTVMWLFDADGLLVASNDDAPSGGLGSELVPGSAAATDAGVHTVAVGHFRAYPRDAVGTRMSDPGSGPLETWRTGFGSNEGRYQLDLLAGASGSEGCGESGGAGVRTGNGRCQELGGKGAEKGKAHGLKKNADKRQNRAC